MTTKKQKIGADADASERKYRPFNDWVLAMNRAHTPGDVVMPTIAVHDTLELADRIAHSVFGIGVDANTVLAIYDRLSAERRTYVADSKSDEGGGVDDE